MLTRFFLSAVLLGAIYLFYTGKRPTEFFSKEPISLSQDQWASVLPGNWKDEESGGIATLRADGSYEQEGREKVTEPIENAPFKGTVFIDLSVKSRGKWSLKENQLTFTIQAVDHLALHDYRIESPELVQKHGAEALKKLISQSRRQIESEMKAKLTNAAMTHTLISVQQDRIVSRDAKGKESISLRAFSPVSP